MTSRGWQIQKHCQHPITFMTSRGWHISVLAIPAAAPPTASGEIQEKDKLRLIGPICTFGHSFWFHFSWADVTVRLTHSKVPSSIAWVGIMRSMLMVFPAQSPGQPCFSKTSIKLPAMFLEPTPTTILVLKSQYQSGRMSQNSNLIQLARQVRLLKFPFDFFFFWNINMEAHTQRNWIPQNRKWTNYFNKTYGCPFLPNNFVTTLGDYHSLPQKSYDYHLDTRMVTFQVRTANIVNFLLRGRHSPPLKNSGP